MLYTEILNDNKDFLTLYKKGRYAASKYSVIYVRPNGKPFNRLGITAGKKVGNAVCRNRAKRLIRLAYRNAVVDNIRNYHHYLFDLAFELCFESFRFWDLRRWNANLNETARGTEGDVEVRDYKDYMTYGPIPYSETMKFGNLKQNDGWQ